MLYNPCCSPSTSRATKTCGVNDIPPGWANPGLGSVKIGWMTTRHRGTRTHGSHEYRRKPSSAKKQPEIAWTSPYALRNNQG